jgi:hypothetical protein
MRKTILILLAVVLALSAVEWDVEEVTQSSGEVITGMPIIALDNQGYARVLMVQYNEATEESHVKLADNTTGSWEIKEITLVFESFLYSLDVDSNGNSYVTYSDYETIEADQSELFIAVDTSGEFVITKLTEDNFDQMVSVVQLDNDGIVYILYNEETMTDNQLILGRIESGDFSTEVVSENMNSYDFRALDLVLAADNTPHAFYIGDDNFIYHAAPSTLTAKPAWDEEKINDIPSYEISAAIDASGNFHLSYNKDWEDLYYLTNISGFWENELVADTTNGGNEEPSIAVDSKGNPHIIWLRTDIDYWYDIYYGTKGPEGWAEESVTSTPGEDEYPGPGHYFIIDDESYGHLVYHYESSTGISVYYAKSTEPLTGSSIAEHPVVSNRLALEVHGSSVHFSLPEQGSISVNLYDACGRRVQSLASGAFTAGEHAVPINSTGLAAGVYFIRAEIAERSANAKFVLTR